jgi:hypothetical protein
LEVTIIRISIAITVATKNRNHKSNEEGENFVKTKLSFSAISQTEKKPRKVKKKKEFSNYKSTMSDSSAADA